MPEGENKTIRSVGRMFDIVETLVEINGGTLSELAGEVDMAPSTVHRYLGTLQHRGYVNEEAGRYSVGLRFLDIGGYACHQTDHYSIIEPKIDELAEQTQKRVQYLVEDQGDIVYLRRRTASSGRFSGSRLGDRLPVNTTASGKAILANYPADRTDEILKACDFPELTENTITDEETYRQELEDVRERGHSYNDEEFINGLRTVGVPVLHPNGSVLGSITVSGPKHKFTDEEFHKILPDQIRGVIDEIQLELAY